MVLHRRLQDARGIGAQAPVAGRWRQRDALPLHAMPPPDVRETLSTALLPGRAGWWPRLRERWAARRTRTLPDPAAIGAGHCRNCGAALAAPPPRFCPECGQQTRIRPPTLGEFIQQFGGAYFATEGALWRTLRLLLFRPGELTRLYLAGRRKHYVLPLRLYLTISVVTLLLLRAVSMADVQIDPAAVPPPGRGHLDIGNGRAGFKDGVFYCTDLPAWFCKRLQRRIDLDPKALAGEMQQLRERFVANLGSGMFVLLPSFALWLKLVYLNRRMRYTEHLVFALHVHAFWFVALALSLIDQPWITVPALIAVPIYTMRAMRRVYGGRARWRWLRAVLVSTLYSVTVAFAVVGVGLWSLLA